MHMGLPSGGDRLVGVDAGSSFIISSISSDNCSRTLDDVLDIRDETHGCRCGK